MVRMSEILKKIKERKDDKQPGLVKSQEPVDKSDIKQAPEEKIAPKSVLNIPKEDKTEEIKVWPPASAAITNSKKAADKVYLEAFSFIKEMLKEDDLNYRSIDIQKITLHIERIIDQLHQHNDSLIELSLVSEESKGAANYLHQHLLNTSILAIAIAVALGYDRKRLIRLGISSMLFDIALARRKELIAQPRKLAEEEYKEIKNHAREAEEILGEIEEAPKIALDVAQQHHERIDGSGYPQGLKKENIKEFSQIIGLADTYEALTHKRAHRPGYNPFEAMKIILNHKNIFDSKIIRALLEKVGLYPVGSIVKLSTNERAKVIRNNLKRPLSPKVQVIYESEDEGKIGKREIDLSTTPTVHIISCLSCDFICIN